MKGIMIRKSHRLALLGFFAAVILLAWSESASAIVIGNPSPEFKKGDLGVGFQLSDLRETLELDWGMFDAGTLQVLLGTLDNEGKTSSSGKEGGIGYRHKLDPSFNIGKFPVHLGIVAIFRGGKTKVLDQEFSSTVVHLGVGGVFSPLEHLNTYAVALYERSQQEKEVVRAGGVKVTTKETDSGPGAAAGAEYWITPSLVGGIEAHANLVDSTLAVFGTFKF